MQSPLKWKNGEKSFPFICRILLSQFPSFSRANPRASSPFNLRVFLVHFHLSIWFPPRCVIILLRVVLFSHPRGFFTLICVQQKWGWKEKNWNPDEVVINGGWEKNPEIQMKLRSSGKNWIQRGKGWRRKVDKERGGKEGKGTSRRLVTVTVTEPSGTIAS